MSVSLRNVSGSAREVGGQTVDVDALLELDGDFAAEQPADAHVIGEGADARAYPHAHWSDETTSRKGKK